MSELVELLLPLFSDGWDWVLSWSWWQQLMLLPGIITLVILTKNARIVVVAIRKLVVELAILAKSLRELFSYSIKALVAGTILVIMLTVGMDMYNPNDDSPPSGTSADASSPIFQGSVSTAAPTPPRLSSQIEIGARLDLKGYEFIYLQSEPNLKAKEVERLYDDQTRFLAVGKSRDSNWIFVDLMDGTEGWIKSEFVIGDQSLDLLPVHKK